MARGALSGFLVGGVLSGIVVGGLSVLTYPPASLAPEATPVDVPAGSEFNQSREDRQADLPQVEATPEAGGAPKVTAPEPDDLSSLEDADTAPAGQPATGAAEDGLAAPAEGEAASGVEVDSDSPVLPSPQAVAPEAPESESDLSISTEPAQPVQPEIDEDAAAFPTQEGESAAPEDAEAPAEDAAPDAAAEPAEAEAADPAPEDAGETAPEEERAGEAGDAQAGDTQAGDERAEADPAPEAAAEPEVEADAAAAPAEDAPSGTIDNLARGVTTDRLPSVGDEDAAPDAAESDQADAPEAGEAQAAKPAEDMRPPLEKHAAAFENPEGKPLMSIVLIDDGMSPIAPDAVLDFPYPITLAVDASWTGAMQRSQAYRAAGLEVVAIADLPEAATARDTEVAMQAYLDAVPEAVAVMEAPGDGLQANREASGQMAEILLETGHGLVVFPDGLDTAQKLAAKAGVPSATVFRDFDSEGQDATVIRRFLDQAAFRAGQEEAGVIMVGRLRPDTISALLLWGLQDRASRVALAPVSAVLRGQAD